MAKEVSKTVIGAFVISSIVLIVIGVIVFGSGRFFKETVKCVLYFKGSVKGLNEGAPVVWRGVKVGSIKKVILLADQKTGTMDIPVIIEIEPDKVQVKTAQGKIRPGKAKKGTIEKLVEMGLKGRLTMQSIVTGQLMIDLDFHPDAPINLVKGEDFPYPEIPTMQSTLEQLAETIQKLPIKEIFEKLENAADNIAEIAGDPELKEIVSVAKSAVANANRLITHTDTLVVDVDKHVEPLAESITTTAEDAQKLIHNVDGHVDSMALKVEEAVDAAREALGQAEKTLEGIEALTAEDSVTNYRINKALVEVTRAARSMRTLTNYLEQYPDAPLRGKGTAGGK
jgi:paraquat-inducible protein B